MKHFRFVVFCVLICSIVFVSCNSSDEDENNGGERMSSCPDDNHPHAIDLGLPSGTKWACCNVGASKPEDYGGYFAWGETVEKDYYDWNTYLYGQDDLHIDDIGKDIAGTQYDAATANWGNPWVMPNDEQLLELLYSNAGLGWITENGVIGCRITGTNGTSIFLPAAGYHEGNLKAAGGYGCFWSSTLYELSKNCAWHFYCGSWATPYSVQPESSTITSYLCHIINGREKGLSVRPVVKN